MPIQKDSSIWESTDAFQAVRKKDMSIRIGMVRDVVFRDGDVPDVRYVVEVFSSSNQLPISCTLLDTFGGVYNYEEFTHRGFTVNQNIVTAGKYSVRAGDVVLVAYANGDSREGLILGGLKHPARPLQLSKSDGVAYASEFNGLSTTINSDGEYTVTFKGTPTNADQLDQPSSGSVIPAPTYDTNVGGSFYTFDKTGSWTISDAAQSNPQSIFMDKANGMITITSGQVTVVIDKNAQKVTETAQEVEMDIQNGFKITAGDFSVDASNSLKLKSPQVAIGSDGVELLDQVSQLADQIGQLITALGSVTPIANAPFSPTNPLLASPSWAQIIPIQLQIQMIQTSISSIKGSL